MSIAAIANIVSTNVTASPTPRPEPVVDNSGQPGSQPPVDGQVAASQQDAATVTTLSDAALALQAADDQAARDAAAAASASDLTSVVYRDWIPGATTGADGAVQEALDALTEASRENLQAAADAALKTAGDQASFEKKVVDDAAALAVHERDATVLFALNADIRLAYGGLPSPGTGDPVLRAPGQLDVIA